MQLIKINQNASGQNVVSARELYSFLGFDISNWAKWYKKNIEGNEFAFEGQDWELVLSTNKDFSQTSEKVKGKKAKDFALTIDFAKRLSMMARTEKGEQLRRYFVELEKAKDNADLLTHEEVLQLTMLVRCFSYLENCEYAEQMNMQKFVEQSKSKNPFADFHLQRNRILELDKKVIEQRLKDFCIEHERSYAKGLTKREKMAIYDKYEILKAGVWDYLTFKGSEHALKLANLCKEMARISNGEMYKENKTDLFRLQEEKANVLQLSTI